MSERPVSLRSRLLIGLAILAFIGVGLQFLVFARIAQTMREDVARRNLDLAHALAGEIGNAISQPVHALTMLTRHLEAGLRGQELSDSLRDILRFNNLVDLIQVMDNNGLVQAVAPYNPEEIGLDFSTQPFFTSALSGREPVFSNSFISPQTSQAAATISLSYGGGVAAMQLRLDAISTMASVLHPRAGVFIAIVDNRGMVIGHTDPEAALRRDSVLKADMAGGRGMTGDVTFETSVGGVEGIMSVSTVSGAGWRVVVFEPSIQAYGAVRDLYFYTLCGVAVVALCSVLAMYAFQAQLLKPLASLTGQTRAVAGGRYDVALSPAFKEFLPLADSFAFMASQLKAREQALLVSQQRLASVVGAMPSFLASMDGEGRVEHWNEEARKLTGVSSGEARGQLLEDAVPQLAVILPAVEQSSRMGIPVKWEKLTVAFQPGRRVVDVLVYPLPAVERGGVVLRIDDITDRIRMEEVMVHTEKMMTVGGLAAGMAHEINNPLGGILMSAQNLVRRLDPDLAANREAAREAGIDLVAVRGYLERREVFQQVENIRELGARAGKIVANMLGFARRSNSGFIPVRLEEIVERSLELTANDYDLKKRFDMKSLVVHRDFPDGVPPVPVNRNQVEQVLVNLFKNAAQAMAAGEGGGPPEMWIATRLVEEDMVELTLRDNGPGVPDHIRERVFEPFFTTKEVGQGTGLGLSVSYYIIVTMHKGSISVDSPPEGGARFTIRLPVTRPQSACGPLDVPCDI